MIAAKSRKQDYGQRQGFCPLHCACRRIRRWDRLLVSAERGNRRLRRALLRICGVRDAARASANPAGRRSLSLPPLSRCRGRLVCQPEGAERFQGELETLGHTIRVDTNAVLVGSGWRDSGAVSSEKSAVTYQHRGWQHPSHQLRRCHPEASSATAAVIFCRSHACGVVRKVCCDVSAPRLAASKPSAAPLPPPKPAIACTS
jgi:hypothetical protein